MTVSTRGVATETLGGGGGAVACFSSHAASAAAIIRQARIYANTPDPDRFTRSSRIADFVTTLLTHDHQSGGGIFTLLAFFDDGSPGAPGRKRTDEGPPGPQSVRSAMASRVAGGTKS